MCLITNDKTVKIADKNIVCYKTMSTTKMGRPCGYGGVIYKKYKRQNNVTLGVYGPSDDGWYNVEEGYHSRINFDNNSKPNKHLFVIPKGAEYLMGGENDEKKIDNYVSTNIIYLGKNNKFNRYLAKLFYNV